MPSCRDIRPEVWEHARQSLVFYFSRRERVGNAEDLAQETLLAFWRREDFQFDKEEDFLRVCYGFANLILQHDYRRQKRRTESISPEQAAGHSAARRFEPAELRILLDEILRIGRSELREEDWKLIETAVSTNPSQMPEAVDSRAANRIRVRLSRARSHLMRVTGWGG
ncbi:MAG: hypothetical protein SFV51_31610 [Bryobacteraceae bacterium]|nr:hypothetical protein [Bryobacteraceae bacterium]